MKSVQGFNYLYRRNSTYYFRFALRKHRTKFQIMFSLHTKILTEAIAQWQILSIEIEKLKKLVVRCQMHETEVINGLVNGFKISMQKQLKMHHIDPMIAELEQSYNLKSHTYKVIGSTDPFGSEFPDRFHNAYTAMINADTKELGMGSLYDFFAALDDDEQKEFGRFFTGVMLSEVDDNYEIGEDCVAERARRILSDKSFNFDEDSIEFKVLLSKLATSAKIQHSLVASINNGNAIKERELTQLLRTAQAPMTNATTTSDSPLFSEVYAEFLDHKINKEQLTDKIQKDYARRIIVWQMLAEDKAIDLYTPQDIGRFIDRCFELPKMNLKPYKNMTWAERLEVDPPEDDLATPKSVSHYYKWLQGVFSYAMRDTIGYIKTTPCTIKRSFKANVRGVFDDQELKQFLKAADGEGQAWKKWIIYLVIYTGARRGELVQLRKEDVKVDEKTGRHYLLITDAHESQKLKTENAKRKIPLHQAVIDAGFLDYVGLAKERVFEDLASSEAVTRWFARQMIKLEVNTVNELGEVRSYHSFRHSFITKLMNNSVQVNLLQQVVGHEISSFGITGNYTHKTTELGKLLCVVDAFEV